MEDRKIAIRIQGVSKKYRLGAIGGRTLQADLQSWWALRRGKEDPNSKIDMNAVRSGARINTNPEFYALEDINLAITKGERLGIIGANGAGKSTLLKLLSRVTAPTTGDIDIYGRISSLLEIGTGFHSEMTGRENVYMNGAILGMTRAEIDAKIEDIIEFSEVREFIDTPVKRYSSGMLVKLAFSVAAHLNSEIITMDEVLAVGDMAFQTKCIDRMRAAADDEGRTILYVSHNMATIRKLCDRCIVMDHGHIIYDGDVEHAIAVYMNSSIGDNSVDIDLTQIPHAYSIDDRVRMTHLTLSAKTTAFYARGEALRLELTVHAAEPIDGARFRLTIRDEADVGIGTAWSNEFWLKEGVSTHDFTVPLDRIAKGNFYASIGIYRDDEIGNHISLDHVTRAFRFELDGLPVWNTNSHGYIQLEIR